MMVRSVGGLHGTDKPLADSNASSGHDQHSQVGLNPALSGKPNIVRVLWASLRSARPTDYLPAKAVAAVRDFYACRSG